MFKYLTFWWARRKLKSDDINKRIKAISVLSNQSNPLIIQDLTHALNDSSEKVVFHACRHLVTTKPILDIFTLIKNTLKSEDKALENIAKVLEEMGDWRAKDILKLNSASKEAQRLLVLKILIKNNKFPELIDYFNDLSADLRALALSAFEDNNSAKAFEALLEELKKTKPSVVHNRKREGNLRIRIIEALGKTRNVKAIPILIEEIDYYRSGYMAAISLRNFPKNKIAIKTLLNTVKSGELNIDTRRFALFGASSSWCDFFDDARDIAIKAMELNFDLHYSVRNIFERNYLEELDDHDFLLKLLKEAEERVNTRADKIINYMLPIARPNHKLDNRKMDTTCPGMYHIGFLFFRHLFKLNQKNNGKWEINVVSQLFKNKNYDKILKKDLKNIIDIDLVDIAGITPEELNEEHRRRIEFANQ